MSTAHSYSATGNTHPTTQVANSTSSEPLPCPRCSSCDTKFCYYNNYNLTQPRHYCRTCRRYWTQGGTLRNVPVGGGCRKNKQVYNPSDFAGSITQTSFTIWNRDANSNFAVLDAQESDMSCNGFQLIQSEAAPAQPFQVDVSGLGIEHMNQYANGYDGNADAFSDRYQSYDSNVEFGSVSAALPSIDSDFGYWNPGSAWPDYPTTSGAFL